MLDLFMVAVAEVQAVLERQAQLMVQVALV
jgi:hypothetical protein